jgi:hypothetical protein
MTRFSVAKEEVVRAIDDIVPELFGGGRSQTQRYANRWAVLNRHRPGAKLSQMSVWRDGGRRGAFKDYGGEAHGDAIDLVAYGRWGIIDEATRKQAVEWIEDRFGLRHLSAEQRAGLEAKASADRHERQVRDDAHQEKLRGQARKAFYAAAPAIEGTEVETYYAGRAIALDEVPNRSEGLRYRADCSYWMAKGRPTFPAQVACMVDGAGHIRANHYTFLEPDGSRKLDTAGRGYLDENGDPVSAKLMFPATFGLFVPVTYGPAGIKHYKAPEGSDLIGLTEGIEDALSAAIADESLRMHAAGSLSGLLGVPNLACARGYLVFRDNDWDKPQAVALFDKAIARLRSFGKPVEVTGMPAAWGKDVNDALRT